MRLEEQERSQLINAARSIAREKKVSALIAYGSKVAGYARNDSDYDAILVLDHYTEGIRYRYVEKPVNASFLVVDKELFLLDASSSYLGEFVSGRLLNVYEPIVNQELARSAEISYKKRVILETLYELSTEYGEFLEEVLMPYEFFLFYKLKKRARIYPPALYSYVKTYTCKLAEQNKEFSISGFREAAKILEQEKIVSCYSNYLKIRRKVSTDAFGKVLALFTAATKGITQYAVHGYAGRVSLKVVGQEAISKIRRREKELELTELDQPEKLLRAEGDVPLLFSEISSSIAEMFGLRNYTIEEKGIGEPYSTTSVLRISDEQKNVCLVVKKFSDVRSFKWVLLSLWAAGSRKFSMTPTARMHREFKASYLLMNAGIKVPRIVAVFPEQRALVKEFIDGDTLNKYMDELNEESESLIFEYGRVLARAHKAGIAVGDTKPENVIVHERSLYITDLEQASERGDYSWDIAEFLFYSSKLTLNDEKVRKISRIFLSGYLSLGEKQNVISSFSSKYVAPFAPFLKPGIVSSIKEVALGLMN